MHAHDVTIFTNLCFFSFQEGNNSIVFKKLHFQTRFQNFAFSELQKANVV